MAERYKEFQVPRRSYNEDDFDGYQAAPLLIVGPNRRKALVERQDRLAGHLASLAKGELDKYAKPRTVDFVIHSIVARMHQREALNGMGYHQSLYRDEPHFDLAPEGMSMTAIKQARVRSRNGGATPFQQDVNRRISGSGEAEVANLTMIGPLRKSLEIPMWEDISELVGQDATPIPEDTYGVRILGFDYRDIRTAQHIGAMRLNMKRFIGHTDDGATVKSRTTAIINTSPSSGFDQSIIEEFKEVGSYAEMAELPSFKKAVAWLISSELPSGLVLARNETVYEEHLGTKALIRDEREERDYALAA